MTNKDQICHCPQFHKGKCTPETAKNYSTYYSGNDLNKSIKEAIKKHLKKNKKANKKHD